MRYNIILALLMVSCSDNTNRKELNCIAGRLKCIEDLEDISKEAARLYCSKKTGKAECALTKEDREGLTLAIEWLFNKCLKKNTPGCD